MEIEENREVSLAYLRNWVEEVRDSFLSWIAEGEGRSMFTEKYMENDLGWLEICLEELREEILEDKGSNQRIPLLGRVIHLKHRVELMTSVMGDYLKEMEGDEDAELQSFAAMDEPVEAWPYLKEKEEGDRFKEDERDSSAPLGFSVAISLGEAENEIEKGTSHANLGRQVSKEELARDFEAFLTNAARELQTTDDAWVLGLIVEQKFEPLYYLMKGTNSGESELVDEHLGPPPWSKGLGKERNGDKNRERASGEMNGEFIKAMFDGGFRGKCFTADHRCRPKENHGVEKLEMAVKQVEDGSRKAARVISQGNDSGLEKKATPFQFEIEIGPCDAIGPIWKVCSPLLLFRRTTYLNERINGEKGPIKQIVSHWRADGFTFPSLQPQDRPDQIDQLRKLLRKFRPLSSKRPPPKPPDLTQKHPRLELKPTLVLFLERLCSIYLHLSGKVDASGHDPGDIQFHQISSLASVIDSIHSLENKASLNGLVSALKKERHVEDKSLDPRPPAEPPPQPPSDQLCVLVAFISTNSTAFVSLQLSGRKEASDIDPGDYSSLLLRGEKHEDDQMLLLLCHSPRPPEFVHNKEVPLNDRKRWKIG